ERRDDRLGVTDRTARGVDEDRTRFHQPDLARADKAAAARAEHEMHRENVRATKQLVFLDPFDAVLGRALGGQILAPRDRFHAKGKPDARDGAAKPAEA